MKRGNIENKDRSGRPLKNGNRGDRKIERASRNNRRVALAELTNTVNQSYPKKCLQEQ